MSLACLASGDTFIPVTIEENDIVGGIIKILEVLRPTWCPEDVKFKTFTDGITNKLVACQLKDGPSEGENIILIRIYGNKTDLIIDRNAELRNIKKLNVLGLAPKIYGMFENGLAYQYYPGVTLNVDTVVDDKIWPLVARRIGKMHKVELGPEVNKEPFVWDKIEQFLNLLPNQFTIETKHKRFVNSFGSVTKLRIEFERLKSHLLTKTESPIVFAHNDLLLGNVIYNEGERTVYLIDFEYANYNYQAFDIANHFNEYVGISVDDIDYKRFPSKEYQMTWIRIYLTEYLNRNPSNGEVENVFNEVQYHILTSHFLWGIWSLIQFELSDIDFDFLSYAEIRLNKYYELKDKVYKELS